MQSTVEDTRAFEPNGKTTVRRLLDAEWLTALDAAAYAGNIGVSTIREACNRNELRHVRIGGTHRGPIRTRKEWVDEWLHRWTRGGHAV
jgi:excisionase family DNA binding protein